MHSIPYAMIWEFWHKGRWQLMQALAGMLSLPMLIYSAMLMTAMNRLDFQDHGFVTFYFAWLLVQAVSFGGAALISQDSVSRLYQQPITNWSIVAWRLIPGMTATAVLYLASTILLNGIFHLGWPLAGPAIFLACSYPIFQAGMWLGEKAPVVQVTLMSIAAAILGLWLQARHGGWFTGPTRLWTEVTPSELLTLVIVAVAGWYGAYVGICRDRCGDSLKWLPVYEWLESWSIGSRSDAPPYRSPGAAQFWFEWRQKGWLLPLVVLIGFSSMCVVLLVRRVLVGHEFSDDFVVGIGISGMLLPIVGMLVGMVFGQSGGGRDKAEMGTFLASRPVEDQQFSNSVLLAAALSTLLAWAFWMIPVVIVGLLVHPAQMFTSSANRLYPPYHSHLLWPLPVTWIAAANAACAMKTGRMRLMAQLLSAAFLSLLGWFFLTGVVWKLGPTVHEVPMVFFGAAAIVGTILGFVSVLRRRLLALPVGATVLVAWFAACVVAETLLSGVSKISSQSQSHSAISIFAYGVLALLIGPLAFGPLAIAWNRHR